MNKITYFYMAGCPYCRNADKAIEELIKENPAYGDIEVERINETLHPFKTRNYDYYYVPTMFIGETKAYEANPSQNYDDIKASVKAVFDAAIERSKIDEYAEEAKGLWQNTPQWKEYEEKTKGRSKEELSQLGNEMMRGIFGEFGKIKDKDPGCEEAQELVKKLQDFLTEHFYTCTNEVLKGLGMMYACNEDFTKNIDAAGGEGTADFAAKAIEIYCR